ncbi:unnamed protein product, partial [Pocillopora meandrina]
QQRGQPVLTSFISFLFIDECNIVEDERPGVEANKKINKESSGMNQMDNAAADLKSANDNDSNADQAKKLIEFLREDDMDRDDVAT